MSENEYKHLRYLVFSQEPYDHKEEQAIIKIFEEIQQYRAMEKRLGNVSIKEVVDGFIEVAEEESTHQENEYEAFQAYRAIGTVEEFKALKEKSVAKKPLPKGTHKGIDNFYCPNCNHPLTNRHEQCELPYCDICGQKLDWSE